ncbi:MAG: multidrug effflux MFS transporter [Gammaproteobacteria bacterium]|nr:multidrug effflux MFS transporter [Gammaproteobacteria bacterium]
MLDKRTSVIIAIVTAIHALSPLAMQIFVPALPTIRAHFSAELADTQWIISGFSAALALSMLAYGPISDRFGRRRVVLFGLALFCLGSVICYQADSLAMLIIGRVAQAIGVAAGSTMGRAVAADILPPEKLARAVSFMTMALVMGPMLAPVVAGYLVSASGWRSIPLLLGACSALLLLMAIKWMPETHKPHRGKPVAAEENGGVAEVRPSFLAIGFIGHLTILIAVQIGVYGYLSASPYLVIDRLGYEPFQFGYVFIYLTLGYLLGNALSGWGALGSRGLLACGILSYAIGGGLMLGLVINGVVNLYSIVGPAAMLSFANGISQPQCMAAALSAAPTRRGAASSIVGFAQIMAGGVGFQLMGWLPNGTPVPMAALICFCALTGGVGLLLISRRR